MRGDAREFGGDDFFVEHNGGFDLEEFEPEAVIRGVDAAEAAEGGAGFFFTAWRGVSVNQRFGGEHEGATSVHEPSGRVRKEECAASEDKRRETL